MRISKKLLKILLIISVPLLFSVSTEKTSAAMKEGSICILYQGRTKNDTTIPLRKANFVLYNVGQDENGEWNLNAAFKKSYVSLQENSAELRQKQAKNLYQYARKQQIDGKNGQTDKDGRLVFAQLEKGLYLIAQTKEVTYGGKESYISDPFLVSIPIDVDGTMLYHVTAQPKSAWETNKKVPVSEVKKEKVSKKDKIHEKTGILTRVVKTGDFKDPSLWIVSIVLSGLIVLVVVAVKRQKIK